ncbi:hypothetical protein CRENBAI_012194 [Crenichthys baileyi]|uniref:Uncharacterized protein n=1 Tax=Crenichthys baileyi TaxID=28760 RepID=A0AAV9QVK7_9TELE
MEPGQGVHYLLHQELSGADLLHTCVVDDWRSLTGLVPPEVNDESLGLLTFRVRLLVFYQSTRCFILPVRGIIITNKVLYCCFVHKVVCSGPGGHFQEAKGVKLRRR